MKENTFKVVGCVNAADWDEAGRVIMVSILTTMDREYLVEGDQIGRELLEYEGEKIWARGTISENGLGDGIISISEYEVLDDEMEECEVAEDISADSSDIEYDYEKDFRDYN